MTTLIQAYFDGTLADERGAFCAVGEVLKYHLGFRVRDWNVITTSFRSGVAIPDSHKELADMIEVRFGVQNLVDIEDAFHIDGSLLDRVRAVLRRIDRASEHKTTLAI